MYLIVREDKSTGDKEVYFPSEYVKEKESKIKQLKDERDEWKKLYLDLHKLHADGHLDKCDELKAKIKELEEDKEQLDQEFTIDHLEMDKENQRLREFIVKWHKEFSFGFTSALRNFCKEAKKVLEES